MPGKSNHNQISIIASNAVLDGKVNCTGDLRIDGLVNGEIKADGTVTIGTNGKIDGRINAETITVGGTINGPLNAKHKIILADGAVLKGDINTKILVVDAGALINGSTKMNSEMEISEGENIT